MLPEQAIRIYRRQCSIRSEGFIYSSFIRSGRIIYSLNVESRQMGFQANPRPPRDQPSPEVAWIIFCHISECCTWLFCIISFSSSESPEQTAPASQRRTCTQEYGNQCSIPSKGFVYSSLNWASFYALLYAILQWISTSHCLSPLSASTFLLRLIRPFGHV